MVPGSRGRLPCRCLAPRWTAFAPLRRGADLTAPTRSARIGPRWEGRYPRCDKGKSCDKEGRAWAAGRHDRGRASCCLRSGPTLRRQLEEMVARMRLEQTVAALRAERGISQRELARSLGVSQPAVIKLESGRVKAVVAAG